MGFMRKQPFTSSKHISVRGRRGLGHLHANNRRAPQVNNGTGLNRVWRNDLSAVCRSNIVNKIMDTLQRHMPPTGPDGMSELRKIALRYEEKIYTAATSQQDYLRKITLKMLSLETKGHSSAANSLPLNIPAGSSQNNLVTGIMQPPQIRNPAQPFANCLQVTQAHARQQLLSQNLQNSIQGGTMQNSTGFSSVLPSMTGLTQATISSAGGQSSGLLIMTGISQSPVSNSPGQVLSQNLLPASAETQLQSSQQQYEQQVVQQQYQQQSQAQQQLQCQQQQAYFETETSTVTAVATKTETNPF